VILGIIQARIGSTRLPGKVLREVVGKPLLQHMLERVSRSEFVDKFVVATSTKPADDAIEELCLRIGVICYRGSESDVLDRYYQCATSFEPMPRHVVRLTADCPMHDPKVIDFVVQKYLNARVDYATNSFPPLYEDGFDVEVFSFATLEAAWRCATTHHEREHVTPYIRESSEFTRLEHKYVSDYAYKLSVDTLSDSELTKSIFERLYRPEHVFTMNDVVRLLKNEPSLLHGRAQ